MRGSETPFPSLQNEALSPSLRGSEATEANHNQTSNHTQIIDNAQPDRLPRSLTTSRNDEKEKVDYHNLPYDKSSKENIVDCHDFATQNLAMTGLDLKTLLASLPTPPPQDWEVEKISQIAEKLSAGGDKPKVFSESKTQECQVPIYANAVEKQGLYGYTDKPTITQNALTISARGTIGYAVARYEPFCPIVRLIVLIPKANKANLKFLEVVINNIEIEQSGATIFKSQNPPTTH